MKKYLGFMLVAVLTVFTLGRVAFAEDSIETSKPTQPRNELKQKIEVEREALKKEFKDKKDVIKSEINTFKGDIEAKREAFKVELETKKKEFQAGMKTEKDAFKIKLEAEKKEFKVNLEQKRSEFRGKAQEILSGRFEETVKNITNIQDRIAIKIAALKTAGKDVSQAETLLAASKLKLSEAQAKLIEIKALIPTTDAKVTVENWQKIKQGANDVKNLIKEAHQDLINAVKVLKELSQAVKTETSSDDTSATSTQ